MTKISKILFLSASINHQRWIPLVDLFSRDNIVKYLSPAAFWKPATYPSLWASVDARTTGHCALEFPRPRAIRKLIDHFDPDIIHVFGEPSYPLTYYAAKAANGRIFSCKFSQNIFQKWPNYFSKKEDYVLSMADVIHAPAKTSMDIAHQKLTEAKVTVVPWGASNVFSPDCVANKDGSILFVGKLIERKGWRTLLSALEAVDLPEATRVIMVGSGPDEAEAHSVIAASRHRGKIEIRGQVGHHELSALYRTAHVVVMPSKHSDGSDWGHGRKFKFLRTKWDEQFGMVAAEAMLSGTPVVHSDNGSLPEVVGIPELRFPEGDAPELAGRLKYVFNLEAAAYENLIAHCLSNAQRYRWENVASLMKSHWIPDA